MYPSEQFQIEATKLLWTFYVRKSTIDLTIDDSHMNAFSGNGFLRAALPAYSFQ